MTSFLHQLGKSTARHPWRTISIWIVGAVAVFVLAGAVGGETENRWTIPGSDSQAAVDRLEESMPQFADTSARIVVHDADGLDAAAQAATRAIIAEVNELPHVVAVSDPFDPAGPTVSANGETAFAVVAYDFTVDAMPHAAPEELEAAVERVDHGDLRVELGGEVMDNAQSESHTSEVIGLAVAVVVLLVSLGSAIAMALPIVLALAAVVVGIGAIGILAGFFSVPDVGPTVAMMIGLGVGIDYCLFVLHRHRQALHEGHDLYESAGRANATSGQAVCFAGMTVVIAICGLQLSGLPAVAMLGYATALVVIIAVTAAVTLLPAFLGLVGYRVNGLLERTRRKEQNHDVDPTTTISGRWAARVGRKPVRYAVVSFVGLVVLAAPIVDLRIGFADAGSDPKAETQRQAYDLLEADFGPGFNGPLLLTVDLDQGARPDVDTLAAAIGDDPGIAAVTPATYSEDGKTAVFTAVPTTAPEDETTSAVVTRLRDEVIPTALDGTGVVAHVGGNTALLNDLSEQVTGRLMLFISAVVLLSFLLLMVVFRSIAVPMKAAVMNLLSIGASYGFMVAVFQWGWGKSLVGLESTIPINPFVPMMMFAILFGLSMDYEVFLISRIREEWTKTHNGHDSVVTGLASTARVITSAAIIMISVFLAFSMNPDPTVKAIGLGLAVAVFLDATVVRMVLVPATMALMGNGNWWLPKWLDRILPHIDIEGGEGLDETPETPDPVAVPAAVGTERQAA